MPWATILRAFACDKLFVSESTMQNELAALELVCVEIRVRTGVFFYSLYYIYYVVY